MDDGSVQMQSAKIAPDFSFESRVDQPVCGIDEAGRGPIAGPVVAAAVVLDPSHVPSGINDSKMLSRSKRESLFQLIISTGVVGVGFGSVAEIDEVNILNATDFAMERAVSQLKLVPVTALVDGNHVPKLPCSSRAIINGDKRSLSIAAASIVAKVTRDNFMFKLASDYTGYGWERNVGYPTKEHIKALGSLGITPHHRKSFGPVARLLD